MNRQPTRQTNATEEHANIEVRPATDNLRIGKRHSFFLQNKHPVGHYFQLAAAWEGNGFFSAKCSGASFKDIFTERLTSSVKNYPPQKIFLEIKLPVNFPMKNVREVVGGVCADYRAGLQVFACSGYDLRNAS